MSGAKYKNAGKKATKAVLKKLKKGKKVYARTRIVRKYKGHKYYGEFTKKKTIKVKK